MVASPKYRFGLVLSGGGFRGAVHLGILKAFQENGIYPEIVAGTSAGSIAAAFYACGVNIDWFAREVKCMKPWKALDPAFPLAAILVLLYRFWLRRPSALAKWPDGLFKGDKIEGWLDDLFTGKTFDELKIPLSVVSVDVESGETVVFCPEKNIPREGLRNTVFISDVPVSSAVRASISLPGVFVPKRIKGRKLIDGGVKNNVPVDVAFHQGAAKVVAVDLGKSKGKRKVESIIDVLMASVDIMGTEINYCVRKEYPALYLYPAVQGVGYDDFYMIPELIKFGEEFAKRSLKEVIEYLQA
ncbi:putative NTE family protein [Fervidicola ferrireducens]|uniref:Putative NTE family protein n=1 Tax=Fervidicola ferrireducens TaxID=520764 RepID=A0A140L806_9FIRM|nr:patatin-like phospholipase family protein [Fervidicola ferrireducens]KXG76681.1 putative NTE family protein [Fervidicola ferrireducens]